MAATDIQILAPEPVDVVVGDRPFVQKPLSLRGTTHLLGIVAVEMQKAAGSPALAALLDTDAESISAVAFVPALTQVLASVPEALPRILAVILTGKLDDADVEYLNENCRLPQAVRILRTFIEQNEPEELIENFMVLRETFTTAVSKARSQMN